jgi:hypothetical protein
MCKTGTVKLIHPILFMQNMISSKLSAKTNTTAIFATLYNWIIKHIKINYFLIFLLAYTAISKLTLFSYSTPFTWEEFKIIDLTSFKEAMFKSPVLRPYVHQLAYIIPITEMLACLLLLFNKTKKAGYYFSLLLLTLFTGYIVYILKVYPHNLPCVCGGVISLMSWKQHLLFNFFFVLITVRAIYLMHKQQPE